jgi:hypothetical protein
MDIGPFLGIAIAGAIAPLVKKYVTAPIRRRVKNLPDGKLRRLLLTPLGYTKKARDEAELIASIEDIAIRSRRRLPKGSGPVS